MKTLIKGYVICDEVEGGEVNGIFHIDKFHLKEPVIYFNEADLKERKEKYQEISMEFYTPDETH